MTAIPGVLLANNVNGLPFSNASGMLLGARRDIHLDGGTQMVVAVAAAPGQGAGGGSMHR
jgi:NaMN:DMB phosphoribosyltransferase